MLACQEPQELLPEAWSSTFSTVGTGRENGTGLISFCCGKFWDERRTTALV